MSGQVTSAVDGTRVALATLYAKHAITVFLIDGANATSEVYKVFVGLALDVHARWGERVGMYIVTRRRERPFEVPCEVAILFDDDAIFTDDAPHAEVIDAEGSARELAPDAAAVMEYLVASSARDRPWRA